MISMPYRVKSQKELLSLLAKSPRKSRVILLKSAKKPLIDAISECVYNTLHGNVHLTRSQKLRLSKQAAKLRKIADKKVAWQLKKRILVQEGGSFFSLLFPLVSTIIGALA